MRALFDTCYDRLEEQASKASELVRTTRRPQYRMLARAQAEELREHTRATLALFTDLEQSLPDQPTT